MNWFRYRAESLLAAADVRIGGNRPWDIRVRRPEFFRRVLLQGSLGLGESYMDGWWECERLDKFFYRVLRARLDRVGNWAAGNWRNGLLSLRNLLFNLQSPARAFRIGEHHYDIGDELFEAMLDGRMMYSCAYWRDAENLDAAQEAKLELIARKLGVRAGMRVLDIGCGWGGAAAFLAEKYGAEIVGITVSERQVEYARRRWQGLPVEFRLQDYRDISGDVSGATHGRFDRVLSVGMFEHVGYRNYAHYLDIVRRCLKPDGLFLLHTIGRNDSTTHTDPWTTRYIFPNSMLPSVRQIGAALEGRFVMEDWHNFGADYDRTLRAWHARFAAHGDRLPPRYDERFRRMWNYYLLASAAAFRARRLQLWQIALSPSGVVGGYVAPR